MFNPNTIGKREARPAGEIRIREYDGKDMRGDGVELIDGFEAEEVEKLLLCGTLGAGSDDAKNNLNRKR